MSSNKVLHICYLDQFIPEFVGFVRDNFDETKHEFVLFGGFYERYRIEKDSRLWECRKIINLPRLIIAMHRSDKIILHSIFNGQILYILAMFPWLLAKSCWVIWGGDLYAHQRQAPSDQGLDWRWTLNEVVRRFAIRRFGYLITQVKGDGELARKWYGAKGQWHECFMYPSNLYKGCPAVTEPHDVINIQVGNSADPSNQHIEAFEKLKPYSEKDIRIYVPLSYGDKSHADTVVRYGKKIFGDKFFPLLEFMPIQAYMELLAKIDIAVFNHNRQQGMGNVTSLLGLGKKVYMRRDVTPWAFYSEMGVKIYDIEALDLLPIDPVDKIENARVVEGYFSEDNLKKQLNRVFQ